MSSNVLEQTTFTPENTFRSSEDFDRSVVGKGLTAPVVSELPAERRQLRGWQVGVTCCAVAASAVLALNIVLTAWAAHNFRDSLQDGVGTAFVGSCDAVTNWSTWLRLAINVLSAVLLSSSNYTMQCLNAPTHQEIDHAHENRRWLDLGIPSFRNLFRIRKQRALLWCLLAVSSIPIHLLYNSAVFKTFEASNFAWAVVNENFFDGAPVYTPDTIVPADLQQSTIWLPTFCSDLGGSALELRALQVQAATNEA